MKIYRMEWKSPYGEPEDLRRKQLIEFCKKNGIKKYSRKRNSQIVELIKEAKDEKIRLCAEAAAAAAEKKDRERRSEKSFYFPNRAWANIISFCNGMLKYKEINSRQEFLENYWRIYQDMLYNQDHEIIKDNIRPYLRNFTFGNKGIKYWVNRSRFYLLHYFHKPKIFHEHKYIQESCSENYTVSGIQYTSHWTQYTYTCNCCKNSISRTVPGQPQWNWYARNWHKPNCVHKDTNIIVDRMLKCYKMRRVYDIPNRYSCYYRRVKHPEITDKRIYKLIIKLIVEEIKKDCEVSSFLSLVGLV
jgi:hypothetical protein